MSEFKIDLKKLKETIDESKSQQASKDIALGRVPENSVQRGKKPFLSELVTSMRHGVKTSAIDTIKAVNDTVEARRGMPPAVAKNVYRNQPQQRQEYVPINENVQPQRRTAAEEWGIPGGGRGGYGGGNGGYPAGGGYGERDDLFEQNIARQMAEYDRLKMSGNPVTAHMMQQIEQGQQKQPQYIVEQQQVITEDRNLEKLVEGAFKNVLTEIYTKNKIQEALSDFLKSDDFVKVVGQAINEIAKRNKAKQGK